MNKFTEKQIEQINLIIREAIYYGGDVGGPYFSNDAGLRAALQKFIDKNDLSNSYRVSSKADMIRIVKIMEIFPCKYFESTGECFYLSDDRNMKCDGCSWENS